MKVSLFLITFLAPHRVKASATPDQHFDPRHPRSRSDDRRHGYLFVGLLRARGVGRQNSPDLGDTLAAEAGKAGDRSAALPARPGRWSGAASGLSHDPEGGGTRACPGSVSGPAGARPACASVNPE